jgi:methylamine---glutamate N-methyltransferase subunit B
VESMMTAEPTRSTGEGILLDVAQIGVRGVNKFLHQPLSMIGDTRIRILNPNGEHNLAVGLTEPLEVDIDGHAGYYIGGMNQRAAITIHGNVGWGVGENIMSGSVRVKGCASECVGASGHGGLVVIEGDASSRCGISMKGVNIVVGGSVGHISAFMAQAGKLVVCGDAGPALGDSLYEAVIYVRGRIDSLGADAREEPMSEEDISAVAQLLDEAKIHGDARSFKRIASARSLYHWNSEHHQEY